MAEELSPAEEARLRRLLARSRHDERVPEDVASRLADVLARLEAGDDEDLLATPAQVHELAARRRRKAVSLLVAAAAVVVLGVGLGQVVDGLGTGQDMDATSEAGAGQAADRTEGRTDGDQRELSAPGGALTQQDGPSDGTAYSSTPLSAQRALGDLLVVDGRLTTVPREGFTRTALRLQRQVQPGLGRGGSRRATLSSAGVRVTREWQGCAPVDFGDGTAVAVLYEGDPAILVFRPFDGDAQVVELLQCGTGSSMRSVTLPAR